MARMVDRLRVGALVPDGVPPETRTLARAALQTVQQGQIIVADNVAEYLYAGTDQEVWDVATDFPGLVPPFESFFVECRLPPVIRSCELGTVDTRQAAVRAVGALIGGVGIEGGWLLRLTPFFQSGDDAAPAWYPVLFTLKVDRDGNLQRTPSGGWLLISSFFGDPDPGPEQHYDIFPRLYPCFLTISFMNCRNVERVPAPELPGRLLRANRRRRRDYQPPLRFHDSAHPARAARARSRGRRRQGLETGAAYLPRPFQGLQRARPVRQPAPSRPLLVVGAAARGPGCGRGAQDLRGARTQARRCRLADASSSGRWVTAGALPHQLAA